MSSLIDTQLATIQRLILPEGTGLHNNTNASLPPLQGSIAYDRSGTPGVIYSGTGLSWLGLNNGDVIGPAVANNNDLVAFDGITGKLLKDSAIPSADVVKASSTSVSGNVVVYNGVGGRVIQDSGIASASLVEGPVSAVNANLCMFSGTSGKVISDSGFAMPISTNFAVTLVSSAGNPDITGDLYIQRIGTMVQYVLRNMSVNALTFVTPDIWTQVAAIPAQYRPSFGTPNPGVYYQDNAGAFTNSVELLLLANGNIEYRIYGTNIVGDQLALFDVCSLYYKA